MVCVLQPAKEDADDEGGEVTIYELTRMARGRTSVIDTGSRQKMNDRLRKLRGSTRNGASGRGGKKYSVEYAIKAKEVKQ